MISKKAREILGAFRDEEKINEEELETKRECLKRNICFTCGSMLQHLQEKQSRWRSFGWSKYCPKCQGTKASGRFEHDSLYGWVSTNEKVF